MFKRLGILVGTVLLSSSFSIPVQQSGTRSPDLDRENKRTGISEAFPRVLAGRTVIKTAVDVSVTPENIDIRSREMSLVNGKKQVLSLPVRIENKSNYEIETNLAHEWYGGLWPSTDFYISVRRYVGSNVVWVESPAYLVGETGSLNSLVKIGPHEKKIIDVRLNWPGTGSCPVEPLINESEPGQYTVKFLLIFRSDSRLEFIESSEIQADVQKTPPQ